MLSFSSESSPQYSNGSASSLSLSGSVSNNKKGYNKLAAEEADNMTNNNINNSSNNSTCSSGGSSVAIGNNGGDAGAGCIVSGGGGGSGGGESDTDSGSDFELEDADDLSDDSDGDEESIACNVCDRIFFSQRKLAHHQQKKRHFGCSVCDSLFPSLMALEHHKDQFDHWSCDDLSEGRSDDEDDDSIETMYSEELERLL